MDQPKWPLSRYWVEQTLTPYLRYAFSHELAYDEDISPKVQSALNFCMRKPDHSSDGNDLILERICHAVDFQYKDIAPDLSIVTKDLESMARWLIRYAQVKGPYELLGRMNIGSGAWQEYEVKRLKMLKLAAKKERDVRLFLTPSPPPKTAPSEDQIDPRLVLATSGQYVSPDLNRTLTILEDQYLRTQVRRAREYREMHPPALSCLQQVQRAAGGNQLLPYSQQNNDAEWTHPQQSQHELPSRPTHAPSYIQHLGQRQSPYVSPGLSGDANVDTSMRASFSVRPPVSQHAQSSMGSGAIPMADIARLRGTDCSNAVEQRARDFRMHGNPGVNLHQHQFTGFADMYSPALMYQGPNPIMQPSSASTVPFYSGATAPLPAQQPQDIQMQGCPGTGVPEFVNHPGFTNIISSFPDWQYGAPTNSTPAPIKHVWE
ncbi:hypothetical protein DE146DRAFT_647967 [Phaeosphaeria sp. MPI-PUGE-AT-0046c]|nr:hypothetical protein DE146DRAFT_647967 [Phaeosphaeria sp. MPI-PUGE-AT-0046c]